MAEVFEHGYAVIVGVDDNNIKRLALPSVAKDVQAVRDVLIHPERCAYKPENVKLLMGEKSTKTAILDALYWLQDKVKADDEATAVIYYSGHGMVDNATDQYYLIPYDIRSLSRVRADAIKADALTAEISSINAKRLLVILDCCHASGMGVKDVDLSAIDDGVDVKSASFPIDLPETKDIPAYEATPGAKDVSDLLDGNGRAILNSSTDAQSSYVRKDGKMSLFTYHLIEALTGYAPHPEDATVVYVTDVMSWVTHEVKKSAKSEGVEQTPVMRTSGVFPIAQLIGGQGVAKGLGGTLPNPLAELPAVGTTFNQQNQTVHGIQVNTGGDAHIGQIGDNINTGGGDYVGGNKTVNEGDVVHGDKVAGDKISVGNISGGTGIAIGSGASANMTIQHGVSGDELNQLFAPLLTQVARHDVTAVAKVQALKAEAGRGEEADDEKMADLIGDIAEAAPSVVEGLVNLFTNSIIAKVAGGATKYMLKRIRK